MRDYERGSGRTTRAIEAAPHGAFYIVAYASLVPYTRDIARKAGRLDLKVIPRLDDDYNLRGIDPPLLVFDHYQGERG